MKGKSLFLDWMDKSTIRLSLLILFLLASLNPFTTLLKSNFFTKAFSGKQKERKLKQKERKIVEKKGREKDGTRRRKTGVREKEFGSVAAASTCSIIHSFFVSFLSSTLLPSSIFRCFQMYTIHEIGRYIDMFVPKVNSSQRWNHRRRSSGIDR